MLKSSKDFHYNIIYEYKSILDIKWIGNHSVFCWKKQVRFGIGSDFYISPMCLIPLRSLLKCGMLWNIILQDAAKEWSWEHPSALTMPPQPPMTTQAHVSIAQIISMASALWQWCPSKIRGQWVNSWQLNWTSGCTNQFCRWVCQYCSWSHWNAL